jgi:hypothetical protein
VDHGTDDDDRPGLRAEEDSGSGCGIAAQYASARHRTVVEAAS